MEQEQTPFPGNFKHAEISSARKLIYCSACRLNTQKSDGYVCCYGFITVILLAFMLILNTLLSIATVHATSVAANMRKKALAKSHDGETRPSAKNSIILVPRPFHWKAFAFGSENANWQRKQRADDAIETKWGLKKIKGYGITWRRNDTSSSLHFNFLNDNI